MTSKVQRFCRLMHRLCLSSLLAEEEENNCLKQLRRRINTTGNSLVEDKTPKQLSENILGQHLLSLSLIIVKAKRSTEDSDTLETLSNYDDNDNKQNNSSARASRFLEHFLDVHRTTTTWNIPMRRFMEDVDTRRHILLLYLNMDKTLQNSTPRKVAYIWRIERFQIEAIKFERTQIHFF